MKAVLVRHTNLSQWLPAAVALACLALAPPQPAARAGQPADKRPDYAIGYAAHRTNLPGGQHANFSTMRAFVVQGDGSGTKELGKELVTKPNQYVGFAGWSPDGRQAILYQGWESEENGAWEHKHKRFRFTAEHWLHDIILFDMESQKTTNITAVERVSFYNVGLHFWPENKFSFSALIDGQERPYQMDRDGKDPKPVPVGPGFTYGVSPSPDGKRICYLRDYRLYLADADGKNAQPVKDNNPFHFLPRWSPTGAWLAYLSGTHYDCHPHLLRPDGTGLRKLADRGGYRGAVELLDEPDFHSEASDGIPWSPDGKWLYYTAKVGKALELMRVSPEGQPEQLTRSEPGALNCFPQVSPDSKWVLFSSTRSGRRQLYVARADGSAAYPVTKLPAGWGTYNASWRPK